MKKKITKASLVETLRTNEEVSKREVEHFVDLFFMTMTVKLTAGDEIRWKNFGKFFIQHKSKRVGRNPATCQSLVLPARDRVAFKASVALKEMVNTQRFASGMFSSRGLNAALNDSEKLGIYQNLIEKNTQWIIEAIAKAMISGGSMEIRGFGTFKAREYPGYLGRNPKTGESIEVAPKRVPFFVAGKGLREALMNSTSGME